MPDTILVVEDDAALAHSITRNLEARGYRVRNAPSVGEAQALLQIMQPQLILLDIELPDGSGWDVLRTLGVETCASTPVVIMSAFRPNLRLVEEMHCRGVLEKPFPMEVLLRVVSDQLASPPGGGPVQGVDEGA